MTTTSAASGPFYEQLGAPVLLYRNREMYTIQDMADDAALWNASASTYYRRRDDDDIPGRMAADLFYENQAKLTRCHARWYYPIDYHIIRSRDHKDSNNPLGLDLYREWKKRQPPKRNNNNNAEHPRNDVDHDGVVADNNDTDDENDNDDNDDDYVDENPDDDEENPRILKELPKTRGNRGVHITKSSKAQRNVFRNKAFADLQTQPLQLEARAHMVLTNQENPDDYQTRHHVRIRLRDHTQLDTNYVPAIPLRIQKENNNTTFVHGITSFICQQTQQYDRQRMDRADPAYLAPFSLSVLRDMTRQDIVARGVPMHQKHNVRRDIPAILQDDPNAPTTFGNCLCSFPCECGVCRGSNNPVICLLHPVGPLQERVRLSFLQFPNTRKIIEYEWPRKGIPEEINVGDRLRQIKQCGRDPLRFVARTSMHWTVFSVRFVSPDDEQQDGEDTCWGAIELRKLYRIDCRTQWKGKPSFRPLDVTCHPNYGVGVLTSPKLAILYESQTKERNILHDVQVGASAVSVQKYRIANLQEISQIEFCSHHPMVLWAAARSYVRPALTHGHLPQKKPRIGHGFSLFSVDLRQRDNTMATFQWSPSAEEFVPENIHSISGIFTDWNREHSLFVASISASKTWEIDTRMPCRSILSWSLSHFCDDLGLTLPSTGFYGGGIIFSMPYQTNCNETQSSQALPIFSVGKSAGIYSIHALQRPTNAPFPFTKPTEIAMGPDPSQHCSVLKCGAFPLPDVSDKTFTCGLTSFCLQSKSCLCDRDISNMECNENDLFFTISLTNKGDMYAHCLVESFSTQRRAKAFPGHPVGASIIPVKTTRSKLRSSWNVLSFEFSNQLPIPSRSISQSTKRPAGFSSTIDLSHLTKQNTVSRRSRNVSGEKDRKASIYDRNDGSTTEEFSGMQKLPVIVSTTIANTRNILTLPLVNIDKNAAEGPSKTVEHFMPKQHASPLNAPARASRSDITPEVLKKAEADDYSSAGNDDEEHEFTPV